MNIQTKQHSSYIGDNRWDWAVWLAGPAAELDRIDCVTYTLHPTFPNPVREVRARKGGFRLKSRGWGEFTIYIDIAQKNGEHIQLSHDLKLPMERTKQAAPASKSTKPAATDGTILQESMPAIKDMATAAVRRAMGKVMERLPASTVFVSGGVADADAVHRLKSSLANLNVNIISTDDMPSDVPFQVQLDRLIGQSNLAVFLVSGRPSMWMDQEIETAKRHGKRIVPVLVGEGGKLPEKLRDHKSLRINKLDNIADLAQGILKL